MLEISTNTLKARKRVEIDGQPYTVRKLGAGEQLAINQLLREAKKLEATITDDSVTDEQEAEIEQISQKIMSTFAGLFDDGGDGSKSRALISSLNEDEIQEMFVQIFKDEPTVS